MNRVAFQTYGTKKLSLFQSVWKTDQAGAIGNELAGITATGTLTNWALAGTTLVNGGYTHTAGSTAVLQFGLVPTQGQSYRMQYTATGTGTFVINLGGVSSTSLNPGTNVIVTLTPKTAATLSITPSSNFVGTVSLSIKQSSSATNQIQLPISIASGKSIWVDWGDGQYSTMNNSNIVANRIHTYAAPDTYTVRVFGDDFTFGFGNGGFNDRLKLRSISSWGKLKIVANSFYGCSYVTMSGITDIPNLTGVTDLSYLFYDCREVTTIGRINEWNTSSLINATALFRGCYKFNSDISNWNVSNVTQMAAMLYDARVFNQPIGSWNVSKVTNMTYMFSDAYAFNQPIGNWDLSSLVAITYMFRNAYAFNQNLSNWNVSNVTDFQNMFESATAFNNGSALGLANQLPWNINTTAASVNMLSMFKSATAFNSNLGTGTTPWNISKVTTFADMFYGASNFRNGDDTAPINNWNIGGNVTAVAMTGMFRNAIAFNRNISSWNVTKVNSTSNMFYGATAFNQPIGSWNVGNVNNMSGMFRSTSAFNQPIGSWDVSKVTDMSRMFNGATTFNQPIGSWNVSNVTNMNIMFGGATTFNQPIETWAINTTLGANVNMSYMFVTTGAFNQPLDGWNTSEVTNMSSMFGGSVFNNGELPGVAGTLAWNTGKVTSMSGMFGSNFRFNCNVGGFNVSACTDFSIMFQEATSFNNGGNSSINNWNIGGSVTAVDMSGMFKNAIVFNQDISSWSVSKVTQMDDMFNTATAFNKSLSNWERVSSPDTSTLANVTTMDRMFQGATAFNNGLAVGLPSTLTWNTIGVTTMSQMFNSAGAFNCNIGGFNVSNCFSFNFMFRGANRFNNGNNASIGNWILKTTGSIDMGDMFYQATAFNQPIGSWNVSNVTQMFRMFQGATAFNQNIGTWNVSNVINFTDFMNGKAAANFSTANLDAIYNGWSALPSVKPNIIISFGTANYTSLGATGRALLAAPPNGTGTWTIADGGII